MGRRRRSTAGSLVVGLFLIALGALFLADNVGYDVPGSVWKYWPFLLLAMGVARFAFGDGDDDRRGGYWLIATGLYGWIAVFGLFGLGWGTAWPIMLVAVGVSMVAFRDRDGVRRPAEDGRA